MEGRCTALTVQRTLPPSAFPKTRHESDTGGGVGGEEIGNIFTKQFLLLNEKC